jgi:hypothetical protein
MATNTPWGASQGTTKIAPGIVSYSTAGHGGIHLSKTRVGKIAEPLKSYVMNSGWVTKKGDAWLEEDCDWCIAALAFPSEFPEEHVISADRTMKNYYPDIWEKMNGRQLEKGESRTRDEQNFLAEHKDDYLVISAWGSWAMHVPEGMVGVCAIKGGHRNYKGDSSYTYWLVPELEYQARAGLYFMIDPIKHVKLTETLGATKKI